MATQLSDQDEAVERPTPLLRIRLLNIDTYQASPGPLDRHDCAFTAPGSTLHKVPVIRIFGVTDGGQKVCCHVHQVYPHLLVEYKGSLEPVDVNKYIYRLGMSINHAMAVSLHRNPHDHKNSQFVAAIVLCKGVPFYGFHVGYSFYLKVYILEPKYLTRLVALLESGSIMRTVFQPYESHIPYLLQFFLDFNLYGCGWMEIKDCRFRQPLPPDDDSLPQFTPYNTFSSYMGPAPRKFTQTTVASSQLFPSTAAIERLSFCTLELDITGSAILNRLAIKPRYLHHDFVELSNPLPSDAKYVPSVKELWKDEAKRRKAKNMSSYIDIGPSSAQDPKMSTQTPQWQAEERLRKQIDDIIREEQQKGEGHKPSFQTFVKRNPWEKYIMTTFESTEALMEREQELSTEDPSEKAVFSSQPLQENSSQHQYSQLDPNEFHDLDAVDVDEEQLASQDLASRMQEDHARQEHVEERGEYEDEDIDWAEFEADEDELRKWEEDADDHDLDGEVDAADAADAAVAMEAEPPYDKENDEYFDGLSQISLSDWHPSQRTSSPQGYTIAQYDGPADLSVPLRLRGGGVSKRPRSRSATLDLSPPAPRRLAFEDISSSPVTIEASMATGRRKQQEREAFIESAGDAAYNEASGSTIPPGTPAKARRMPKTPSKGRARIRKETAPQLEFHTNEDSLQSSPPSSQTQRILQRELEFALTEGSPTPNSPRTDVEIATPSQKRRKVNTRAAPPLLPEDDDILDFEETTSQTLAANIRKSTADAPPPKFLETVSKSRSPSLANSEPDPISSKKVHHTPTPSNPFVSGASQPDFAQRVERAKALFEGVVVDSSQAITRQNSDLEPATSLTHARQLRRIISSGPADEDGLGIEEEMTTEEIWDLIRTPSPDQTKFHQTASDLLTTLRDRSSSPLLGDISADVPELALREIFPLEPPVDVKLSSPDASSINEASSQPFSPKVASKLEPPSLRSRHSSSTHYTSSAPPSQSFFEEVDRIVVNTVDEEPNNVSLQGSVAHSFPSHDVGGLTESTVLHSSDDQIAHIAFHDDEDMPADRDELSSISKDESGPQDSHCAEIGVDFNASLTASVQDDLSPTLIAHASQSSISRRRSFFDAEQELRPTPTVGVTEPPRKVEPATYAQTLKLTDIGSSSPSKSIEQNRSSSSSNGRRVQILLPERSDFDSTSRSPSPESAVDDEHVKEYQKELAEINVIDDAAVKQFIYAIPPPSAYNLMASLQDFDIPHVIYKDAHYSNPIDVPVLAREYAGKEWKFHEMGWKATKNFESTTAWKTVQEPLPRPRPTAWQYMKSIPPSFKSTQVWLQEESRRLAEAHMAAAAKLQHHSQSSGSEIAPPTQHNAFGFKYSQTRPVTNPLDKQHMSVLALEIHINTRGRLLPNPDEDQVVVVFYCLQTDDDEIESNGLREGTRVGILCQRHEVHDVKRLGLNKYEITIVDSELDLFNTLIDIIRNYDPEIITGYEVQSSSWGFLIERARKAYDYNLCDEFARVKSNFHGRFGKENDRWGYNHSAAVRVTGRHILNIWRLMRGEMALNQYTFENVVYHILHERTPHYSYRTLTQWYTKGDVSQMKRVMDYYLKRVQMDIGLLEESEAIGKTSEFARVFGVDFFSVISRGSQFKVESMMLRITKPESFVLVSPSRKQVGKQNAAECLPLVMEPQSAFYNSPLLVLDFQSLYPSVMIAYNLCYSTCLGRIGSYRGRQKLGISELQLQNGTLELLKDHIFVAPNGFMYAKSSLRKSLLAKFLTDLLDTRVMVKKGMKDHNDDKALMKLLNARQLGLKYIANVTYGYTSATFSGRMPCVEIADSIVQTGRETLERAIEVIQGNQKWGAQVVYGDTDSLFVYLPGKSKDEAFDIGYDIADTITAMNPRPVKLKFEKVYLPSVLLAKKRYVGFKYEDREDIEPLFDAKGIETVRRDGTAAGQKMMETCLKILFRTSDLSLVKEYCQRQWTKLIEGRVSVQDFIFAKEVKLGTYSDKGPPPPGALISAKKMAIDPRAEPQYGERVPYVVVHGAPGARLIDQTVAPEVLLFDRNLRLHAAYYINKQLIPMIGRIFNLVGADVKQWFEDMPKSLRPSKMQIPSSSQQFRQSASTSRTSTLDGHFQSQHCVVCHRMTEQVLCNACRRDPQNTSFNLLHVLRTAEQRTKDIHKVCATCADMPATEEILCDSQACPVYFARVKADHELQDVRGINGLVDGILEHAPLNNNKFDW